LKRAQVLAGAQCIEIRGRAAAGLGFALVLVAERAAAAGPASVERMFTAPLCDMGVFSIFLGSAWITRRRPEYHKRFILLAATALVIPGVGHALVQRHAFDGGVGCRSLASNRCLEGLHALARGSTHMKP